MILFRSTFNLFTLNKFDNNIYIYTHQFIFNLLFTLNEFDDYIYTQAKCELSN